MCQSFKEQFCGNYYGYYYSGDPNRQQVYGAALKIQEVNGVDIVQMIAGLSSDDEMNSDELKELFSKVDVSVDEYTVYKEKSSLKRTTLYKGVANALPQKLVLQFQGIDHEGEGLILDCVADQEEGTCYAGGMGLMTLIGGNSARFLKFALVKTDHEFTVPPSLENETVKEVLRLDMVDDEQVNFTYEDNQKWLELIEKK